MTDILDNVTQHVSENAKGRKPINTIYFYAHNAGKFDLKVILKAIYTIHKSQTLELPTQISDPNHDIYQITIKYNGFNIIFRDSMKLLLTSVANLNDQMLGGKYPKIPMNLDLLDSYVINGIMKSQDPSLAQNLFSKDSRYGELANWKRLVGKYPTAHRYLVDYCVIDCEIVAAALLKISSSITKSLGFSIGIKESITISSMAIYVYTHKFASATEPIMTMKMNRETTNFIRKSYIGGRVEVFNSGLGLDKVYHFDVPGMYALCMKKDLPMGNAVYVDGFETTMNAIEFLTKLHESKIIGFFKVSVICPDTLNVPVLGIHESNGKLYFPTGAFTGTWSSHELELAASKGYTLNFISGYVFKTGNPLKGYSELFTDIKNNSEQIGDKPTRTIAKLFLNSLYGKFASHYFLNTSQVVYDQNDVESLANLFKINSIIDVAADIKVVNYCLSVQANPNQIKADKDTIRDAYKKSNQVLDDKNINMAIASAITAHARITLYNLYEEVENIGGKLCYSDTDSVFAWLPSSPFGKPFGPFTWTGNPDSETSDQALFIAPKMYYFKTVDGQLKFKVKGVSTKNSLYTYEELVKFLLEKGSITFTNQQSFNNFPLKLGAGIIIKEGLSKTYKAIERKRLWQYDGVNLWTVPKNVNIGEVTVIPQIPMTYSEDLLKIITSQTGTSYKVAVTDMDNTLFEGGNQYINTDSNTINFNISRDSYEDMFEILWSHVVHTCIYNTDGGKNIQNIKRLQVTVWDSEAQRHCVVFYQNGFAWVGAQLKDLKSTIMEILLKCEVGYDRVYNFDQIKMRVTFNTIPKLICPTVASVVNQLNTQLENMARVLPRITKLQLEISEKQEQLKVAEVVREYLIPYIQTLNKVENQYMEQFLKIIPETLLEEGLFINLDIDYLVEASQQEFRDTLVENIKFTVCKALAKAVWSSIVIDGNINIHTLKKTVLKELNIRINDERGIKLALKAAWTSLIILNMRGLLVKDTEGTRIFDKESAQFFTTQVTYKLHGDYKQLDDLIVDFHILTKIAFVPVKHEYIPDSLDNSHNSKDKSLQLTKINAVKVYFNNSYIRWLYTNVLILQETLIEEGHEEQEAQLMALERLKKLFGWSNNNEIRSGYQEVMLAINYIKKIASLQEKLGVDYFYHINFCDSRGRVYPQLTNISHISHKWLRPLFALENSRVRVTDIPVYNQESKFPFKEAHYFIAIAEEFNVNLTINTKFEDFYYELARKVEGNNWRGLARLAELETMSVDQTVKHTMPIQLDMKNNAMQHIATICNDLEVIKMVGVIPSEENQIDLYETVASKVYNTYLAHKGQAWADELIRQLPYGEDHEMNIKYIRSIVKRSVITLTYSATQRTLYNYIFESLKEMGFVFTRYYNKIMVAIITIEVTYEVLWVEVKLMKQVKDMLKDNGGEARWNLRPVSDFKIRTQSPNQTFFTSKIRKLSEKNPSS